MNTNLFFMVVNAAGSFSFWYGIGWLAATPNALCALLFLGMYICEGSKP